MKIKTDKLTGAALDWAVAKIEGFVQDDDPAWERGYEPFAFSTDWSQGGPLIEREEISVWLAMDGAWKKDKWAAAYSYIEDGVVMEADEEHYGPTPLIAAMRCYVASKLGDDVEIPEELL